MNKKILVVDDEEDILKTLERLLTGKRYRIRCARDSQEAMECLKTEPFDLIISDIHLSDRDDTEFIRQVRQLDEEVKIIAMTGSPTIHGIIRTMRGNGASDLLLKPLESADQLFTAVDEALRRPRKRTGNQEKYRP
jgi:DNA-binding NtrC family response regulator